MLNNLEKSNHDSLDITISYGKSVTSNKLQPTSLRDVLHSIKTGKDGLKEKIEEIRACPDTDKQQELKRQHLPYFNLGRFKDNIRKDANFEQTQLILFDCDDVGTNRSAPKEQLEQDQTVLGFFVSPTGGLKVFYSLESPITNEAEYRKLYSYYSAQFTQKYGQQLDHTIDPSRACFLSYDPDIHVNEDAVPLIVNIPTNDNAGINPTKGNGGDPLADILATRFAHPNRIPAIESIIGHLRNKGIGRRATIQIIRLWNEKNIPPKEDAEIVQTVTKMYNRYQQPENRIGDYWSSGKDIIQIGITKENELTNEEKFFLEKITKEKFNILIGATEDDDDKYFKYLVQQKHIPHIAYVAHVGDMNAKESFYKVYPKEGVIEVHYRPIEVRIDDNQFVENYLERTFGKYKDFIKQYWAVYCYSNFVKLTTIVLTGARGAGKNTFAETTGMIFPSISTEWHGSENQFNPEVEKKLLIADETVSDDPKQYKMLKKYSGQKYMLANIKFVNPYRVRNNINMIILSNENTPIYVKRGEVPTNEQNNQFFMLHFDQIRQEIDREYGKKIADRLGYYCRTELKRVFDSINMTGNRYAIKVPITPEEKSLFVNNITDADFMVDKYLTRMNEWYIHDLDNKFTAFTDEKYLIATFLDNFVMDYRVKRTEILKNLIDRGYLESAAQDRPMVNKVRAYAYKMTDKLVKRIMENDADPEEKESKDPAQMELPMLSAHCPENSEDLGTGSSIAA